MGFQEQNENAPLLPRDAAGKQAAAVAVTLQEESHVWRGSLLSCCSGCDAAAWGSCCLSYFAPCMAFGQNMKRALNLSGLMQAMIYLVLFLGGRVMYGYSSDAVHAACPRPLPPLHHGPPHTTGNPQLYPGLDMAEATPLPGSFNISDMGEHQHHHHHHHHGPPPPMTPECHQALAGLGATFCLMLILAVVGVVYASRRRTQIREKFGIAGSRLGDCCSWCWCAPCALCQETRTIWANNVHNGVWFGQTPLVAPASAYTVPEMENMKMDYKPVDAKDFV